MKAREKRRRRRETTRKNKARANANRVARVMGAFTGRGQKWVFNGASGAQTTQRSNFFHNP